jgi:hypothetical protein
MLSSEQPVGPKMARRPSTRCSRAHSAGAVKLPASPTSSPPPAARCAWRVRPMADTSGTCARATGYHTTVTRRRDWAAHKALVQSCECS